MFEESQVWDILEDLGLHDLPVVVLVKFRVKKWLGWNFLAVKFMAFVNHYVFLYPLLMTNCFLTGKSPFLMGISSIKY